MDVSTAVQLERLDELERQMALIEPPPGLSARAPRAPDPDVLSVAHTDTSGYSGEIHREPPSMALNPRVQAADTPTGARDANDDGSVEAETSYSTH